ncbi:MAG TPA: hypothetical protein VNA11_06925, partial [Pseudonocardia sp.]|nr:hypothetical protein [Pseudonocardia sp.]
MASFTPQLSVPERSRPDPGKHVNFVYGMVLGVDDFDQEFAYHSGRDRWLVRDLAGYGTVLGLQVQYETAYEGTFKGPRISVSPGAAASPSGQVTCVSPTQCAYLDDWLQANQQAVVDRLTSSPPSPPSPPGPLPGGWLDLYVVLCYSDCPTDQVPIPGEPCRKEDELRLPSRLRDDFVLELRFKPTDQREEEAVRRFVGWLRQVPVGEGGAADLDEFLNAIRTAAGILPASPPGEPVTCPTVEHFMAGLPPATLALPEADAAEFLRAAFRLWTTELLPCWRVAASGCVCDAGCGTGCPDPPPGDTDCVTLAHIVVDVLPDAAQNRLLVGPGGVTVAEDDRPYLVDLRVLQEWAVTSCDGSWPGSPLGSGWGSPPTNHAATSRIVAAGRFGMAGNPEFS